MKKDNKVLLDIGCGNDKLAGATGLDQYDIPGVDLVCDLNKTWPVESSSVDMILFRHSINHLDSLEWPLTESYRVLKKGGLVKIIAPHFSSDNIFTDPTVKFFIGYRSLNYYLDNVDSKYKYYSEIKFHLKKRHIYLYKSKIFTTSDKIISCIVKPIEFLVNCTPRLYEKFLCFIIRANEVEFVIRKI